MTRISAGLLMYRIRHGELQVLLAHPGGPLFKKKDEGHWTIPKGEVDGLEDLLETAKREFTEETGIMPQGPFTALTPVRQKGGKLVHAWAFEGDCDPTAIVSNLFTMEWPSKSGRQAEFFDLPTARRKIKPAQSAFFDELAQLINKKHWAEPLTIPIKIAGFAQVPLVDISKP
jgi:predicted NUDIX family NTP pyrophosphohydrolase